MLYQIECIDSHNPDPDPDPDNFCHGDIEYRPSLSGTGTPIPRCDRHWQLRLEREDEITARYPYHAPADFDPYYAGEAWGEEDY